MVNVDSAEALTLARGGEAYISYCSGLAVIQSPFETTGIHNQLDVEKSVDEILVIGEQIMFRSIQRLIREVHPTEADKEARYSFEQNEPKLQQVVEHVALNQEPRLVALNVWYPILRPAPFLRKSVYSNIAAGRRERVRLPDLMDGFVPDKIFSRTEYTER